MKKTLDKPDEIRYNKIRTKENTKQKGGKRYEVG